MTTYSYHVVFYDSETTTIDEALNLLKRYSKWQIKKGKSSPFIAHMKNIESIKNKLYENMYLSSFNTGISGIKNNTETETQFCRLDYHSKQEQFHIANINEERSSLGWMSIAEKIPESIAMDFIEYIDNSNILNTNEYYTWRMMKKEFEKWISKQ
jgi:hypothetical protein